MRSLLLFETGPAMRGDLLLEEQLDRAARIDLRRHLEHDTDILALHGAELIVEIGAERLAGGDRNFLADQHACAFLIVERQHRRRRKDVALGIGLHGVQDRAENAVLAQLGGDAAEAARGVLQRADSALLQLVGEIGIFRVSRRGRAAIRIDDGRGALR